MGHHTFDASRAHRLERAERRYRHLSVDELVCALDLGTDDTVADLGSGTGFYTDDVAPHAREVYAVDIQPAMHDYYREKGVPENVSLITSEVSDLPFAADALDGAFSTMTYHEFASSDALAEIRRVLRPGGRLVVADWSADGSGEHGPPLAERYTADAAATHLRDCGFRIEDSVSRPETFVVIGASQ